MDITDFLASVSIFSLMERSELERIAKLTRDHFFHKGDMIIKEGESDRRLFMIISGKAEVIKDLGGSKERILGSFGPNGYFGEMSLIDDLVRSATVVAKEETHALSLDRWNLRQEIGRHPDLAFELLRMLSHRVRAIEKSMMKTLGGLLPICASCKKIRDESGKWTMIEEYIADRSEAEFSHSICPECAKKLYPEYVRER